MAGLDDYFENGEGVSAENEFIAEVTPGTTYEDSVRGYFDTISSYNIFLLGGGYDYGDLDQFIDPYCWLKYMSAGSEPMYAIPTSFAQATGVSAKMNDDFYDGVFCYWWLRTGIYNSISKKHQAYYGDYLGEGATSISVSLDSYAARPCFVLNLV